MDENNDTFLTEIKSKIHTIREVQVILDNDLAELYEVETRALNQAVKRNINRFPQDFCFQLNEIELKNLMSHSVISSFSYGGIRKLPFVFTEQGVAMLSGLLRSKKAIKVNIYIMRAFILMRNRLKSNDFIFQRLEFIENSNIQYKIETDNKFEKVFDLLENKTIEYKEGIFFEGQIFDAHRFISDLIRKAKKEIILIDNYIDDRTLNLFTKRNCKVKMIIYTREINNTLKYDLEKYNSQYEPISIKELNGIHDRFLIIDEEVYHIGASLKDLGKKLFAFSKLEKEGFKIFEKLN